MKQTLKRDWKSCELEMSAVHHCILQPTFSLQEEHRCPRIASNYTSTHLHRAVLLQKLHNMTTPPASLIDPFILLNRRSLSTSMEIWSIHLYERVYSSLCLLDFGFLIFPGKFSPFSQIFSVKILTLSALFARSLALSNPSLLFCPLHPNTHKHAPPSSNHLAFHFTPPPHHHHLTLLTPPP